MKNNYLHFLLLIAAVFFLTVDVNAQNADKKWGIGFYTGFHNYKGDMADDFWDFSSINEPFISSATLGRYLDPSFDAVLRLSYFNVKSEWKSGGYLDDWIFSSTVNLKYKFNNGYLFKEDAIISPFLVGGIGYINADTKGRYKGKYRIFNFKKEYRNVNFHYGGGLNIRVSDAVSIILETGIYYPLNDRYDGFKNKKYTELYNDKFLHNAIGVVFSFGNSSDSDGDGVGDNRDNCPDTPSGVQVDKQGCPVDTDADGVPDYMDECPMLAGIEILKGCPDSDGDGVADKDDKCPDVKGEVQFKGCPDSDGDGVQDSEDECPDVKGLKELKGCPDSDGDGVKDSDDKCPQTKSGYKVDTNGCPLDDDNDGVVNEEDRCPNQAGSAKNYGCPEIKKEVKEKLSFVAKNVNFESGKITLTNYSKQKLSEVIKIMDDHSAYSLKISGYTDSRGKDDMNLKLSEERAQATKNYLISKGISSKRISAKGFGEANPIADNKTSRGRALNRRVEFELFIK